MELDPRIIKNKVRKAIELSVNIFFSSPAIPPEINSRTSSTNEFSDKTNIRLIAIAVSGSVLAASFIFVAIYVIVRQHSRRRGPRQGFGTAAAAAPEGGGGVWQDFMIGIGEEPYHVWYIKTAGLDEPTIEAITVVPYKKGEGLVDGSDCAVCLGEFQEEEMLRLLPKCNHAFHLPCIDTWLRSHINCPICRAPIMDPNPSSSSSDHTFGRTSAGQASGEESGDAQPLPSGRNAASADESEIWAVIDLGNEDETSEITKEEMKNGEFQPVNRSISMDPALPRFQIRRR